MAVIPGKKAVFFTLSALLLLSVIFAGLYFSMSYRLGEDDSLVSSKTVNMNEFVEGFDQDVDRGIYIAGFRALISSEGYINSNKAFLNDSVAQLREAMMNGTIKGVTAPLMTDSTLTDWLSRVSDAARGIGMIVNISYDNINISQSDPWTVDFFAGMSYNVTDVTGTAAFRRNTGSLVKVSIIGLRDPFYTIFTNGQLIRAINNTPFEGNYATGSDTSNLIDHVEQHFYANSTGPSFLMRLQGSLGNSTYGIESLVNLPDFQAAGLQVYERSSVDYIYFGNATHTIYKVNQTYEDWFRLDEDHLNRYQVYNLRK
jgi:hypothetical protein